jgi:predicted acyl esterase
VGFFDEYHAAMFGPGWKTSPRRYAVAVDEHVKIPLRDGVKLDAIVFRPQDSGRFPAILGFHCYHPAAQVGPIKPTAISTAEWRHRGQERTNASLEAGDPRFFAERGYVHVICNARGTGDSEGLWHAFGPTEVEDCAEVIAWMAAQPWCDGNVGMFGVSYFARIQYLVAQLQPPALKALFCPWAGTDYYRDTIYRGGILSWKWPVGWSATSLTYARCRPYNHTREGWGEEEWRRRIAERLADEDIRAVPELVRILRAPEEGVHPFVVDLLLHPTWDAFWEVRAVDYQRIAIPAYVGGDWGIYGHHLPGAFRSWERLKTPKKLLVGPPYYLDRPLYQMHFEALRWFDYWLKGMETKILQEEPIELFLMGAGSWIQAQEWPLPQTRFTPFFLHEGGLLSEREHWAYEGSDSFEDSPWMRGELFYATPPMVEETDVVGPILLKLYAATTDTDIHWNITLYAIDPGGQRRVLTKGWLKGSHRELDVAQSKPWEPIYTHRRAEPLTPGAIYEYAIKVIPTAFRFAPGWRIGLRISGADAEPENPQELMGVGSLSRAGVSRVTVFHNPEYPSYLLLPIVAGNRVNTYFSGGQWPRRA